MYLLDTNVVSEFRKKASGKADRQVLLWQGSVPPVQLYLSVITVFELELGILRVARRDPAQGALFRDWLDLHVLPNFRNRIIPLDVAVALRAAGLHVPNPRPERDALIAATALVHNLTVVTRNISDFAPTGVRLLNPWNEQP